VLLEKDGKDQLDRLCDKWSITWSQGERNILPEMKRWETNFIGHNLRRNCVLKYFVEGKIEGTRRQGRKCKQLLNGLKEKRKYCSLKKEALERLLWRNSFQRVYGPVTRQNTQ
jgi:hypothetical protein